MAQTALEIEEHVAHAKHIPAGNRDFEFLQPSQNFLAAPPMMPMSSMLHNFEN